VLFVVAFAFRLGFGLSKELFTDDETQIYLLGLRYHATHQWPFFGPDVVWTESEIPGALQALLVGIPLDIAPLPEAHYVLVNLLPMGTLCLFGAYLSARLPAIPRWLIWAWLLTLPWTLEFSTHILNTSYVLPASLIFFIGFFEAWPALSIGRVPIPLAHLLMGAALGWVFQIHMSWPLLLPFAGVAFLARAREGVGPLVRAGAAFAAGLLLTASLALPTYLAFRAQGHAGGGTEQNLLIHWRNPVTTLTNTTGRLLSFASFEVGRFIASAGGGSPIVLLGERLWLVPIAGFVWIVGIVHPVFMAATAFRRRTALAEWPAVRWMTVATAVTVAAGFFFVMEPAQARSFYVVAPVALLFAAYCWTFIDSPGWRRFAAVVLVANVVFQGALAVRRLSGSSLYMNREVVADAIRLRQPTLFAYRRPWARGVPSAERSSADGRARALVDLAITESRPQGVRGVSTWSIVLHNQSASVGYRSVVCTTRYYDAAGAIVEERFGEVWVLLEPGESARARVIDSARWGPRVARAEIVVRSAEPVAVRPRQRISATASATTAITNAAALSPIGHAVGWTGSRSKS
jgi:hypothetical protein